jgi:hypothetical protein
VHVDTPQNGTNYFNSICDTSMLLLRHLATLCLAASVCLASPIESEIKEEGARIVHGRESKQGKILFSSFQYSARVYALDVSACPQVIAATRFPSSRQAGRAIVTFAAAP